MASSQSWSEYNGSGGTTQTASVTNVNWMNSDTPDTTGTIYQAHPIGPPAANSFDKVQSLVFGGTWHSLSALTYSIDAQPTNLSYVGAVISTAATASTTATGDSALAVTGVGTLAGTFGTSSTPFSTAGGSTTTAGGTMFSTALRTQLQIAGGYTTPGDTASRTITATWTES